MSPVVCSCKKRFEPALQIYVEASGSFQTISFSHEDFILMVSHWKKGHSLRFDHPDEGRSQHVKMVMDTMIREVFRRDLERFKANTDIDWNNLGKEKKEQSAPKAKGGQ